MPGKRGRPPDLLRQLLLLDYLSLHYELAGDRDEPGRGWTRTLATQWLGLSCLYRERTEGAVGQDDLESFRMAVRRHRRDYPTRRALEQAQALKLDQACIEWAETIPHDDLLALVETLENSETNGTMEALVDDFMQLSAGKSPRDIGLDWSDEKSLLWKKRVELSSLGPERQRAGKKRS